METIVLTEQEIALLSAAYPNSERIQENRLFDYQVDGLRQLRAGAAYLEQKYPNAPLEVTSFVPANQFTKWAEMTFRADGAEQEYRLTVAPAEGGFDCADDYYGALLRESYDQKVAETVAEGGYTVLSYTEFPSPAGLEVGPDTTAEELIALGPELTRNTHLFLEPVEQRDAAAAQIKDRLAAAGFYGAFTLYFVPSLQGDVLELEAARKTWDYVTFQCFYS